MKKVFALMLALVMVLVVASTYAADLTITNATLGQTYKAYKIFDANPSDSADLTKGISYTATAEQIAVAGFDDVFDTFVDANGNYTISVKTGVTDAAVIDFVKKNIDNLKQGNAITGTYSDNSTYVFSNLDNAYYYIESSLGTLVTIDSAGTSVEVVDKNESQPEEPEKVITAEDSAIDEELDQSGMEAIENDASVGSKESFSVTFQATNWVQDGESNEPDTGDPDSKVQVTEYNFKDTPTGLSIDKDSVKVKVNDEDITDRITDIAVSDAGVLTFTIPWVDTNGQSLYAAQTVGSALIPVVITYNATVTDDAATAAAPNEIEVKYNSDQELGTDTTTTYTYKFKLLKVDENNEALVGAAFELYYGEGTGEALKFTKVEDGLYRFDPTGEVTKIEPVGEDASALIIGLDNATYTLKEVVVPEGYNKAEDTTITELSKVTDADATAKSVTIENKMGTELPSTGGIGTTIFYVVGGLLIIGAAIILVARRKAHE